MDIAIGFTKTYRFEQQGPGVTISLFTLDAIHSTQYEIPKVLPIVWWKININLFTLGSAVFRAENGWDKSNATTKRKNLVFEWCRCNWPHTLKTSLADGNLQVRSIDRISEKDYANLWQIFLTANFGSLIHRYYWCSPDFWTLQCNVSQNSLYSYYGKRSIERT